MSACCCSQEVSWFLLLFRARVACWHIVQISLEFLLILTLQIENKHIETHIIKVFMFASGAISGDSKKEHFAKGQQKRFSLRSPQELLLHLITRQKLSRSF